MPDDSLVKTVETLSATVSRLTGELIDHHALVLKHDDMAKRMEQLEREASDARADKAALEQEVRLASAQRSTKRLQFYLFAIPFALTFLGPVGFGLTFAMLAGGWRTHTWLPSLCIVATVPLCLIPLRPANVRTIRTIGMMHGFNSELFPPLMMYAVVGFIGMYEPTRYHAYPIAYTVSVAWLGEVAALCVLFNTVTKGLAGEAARLGGKERGALAWRLAKEKFDTSTAGGTVQAVLAIVLGGPPFKAFALQKYCAQTMPPRKILTRIFIIFRAGWLGPWALAHLVVPLYYLVWHSEDDWAMLPPWVNVSDLSPAERTAEMALVRQECLGHAICGGVFLLLTLVLTSPPVRGRIHASLCRLAASGEAGRAAGVAALVGKMEPQQVLVLARKRFVGIGFSTLAPSDFHSNVDSGLNEKVERQRLGNVDAFLSHSWHDDPAAKWHALSSWARQFSESTGRDPVLWLDKACILQGGDIDEQLACLPIFLSGCQRLVILAGRSWAERIWCIMELFTFMRMGGQSDRVDLIPIGTEGGATAAKPDLEEAPSEGRPASNAAPEDRVKGSADAVDGVALVLSSMAKFDVAEAKCTKESDKQHLLGVIETGFGELAVFNSLVRHLFTHDLIEHMGQGAAATTLPQAPAHASSATLHKRTVGGGRQVV